MCRVSHTGTLESRSYPSPYLVAVEGERRTGDEGEREKERASEQDRGGGGGGGGGGDGGRGRKKEERQKRNERACAWTESSGGSSARASVRNVVPLLVTVTSAPYHRHVVLYAVEYKCSAS